MVYRYGMSYQPYATKYVISYRDVMNNINAVLILTLIGWVRKMEVKNEMTMDVIHFLHLRSPNCTP